MKEMVEHNVADVDVCALTNLLNYLVTIGCEVVECGWENGWFRYEVEITPILAPDIGGCQLAIAVGPMDRAYKKAPLSPAGLDVIAFGLGIDAKPESLVRSRRLCYSAPASCYLGVGGLDRLRKSLGLVK